MIAKANKVAEIINARGIEAEVMVKNNNGVEQIGITVGDGTVRPTIYPDFTSNDIESIADHVIDIYSNNRNTPDFSDVVEHFSEFDYVKKDIIPVLVNKVSDDLVSRDYIDLKVMYRFIIPDKSASIAIKKEHLNAWGITENDLFEIAKDNVKGKYADRDMSEIIPIPLPMPNVMRVVTLGTKTDNYGASALLFPELFEKYGNGVQILPSSIHELIVLTENNAETKSLCDIIQSVNATELDPKDILSDHPYTYEDGVMKGVA